MAKSKSKCISILDREREGRRGGSRRKRNWVTESRGEDRRVGVGKRGGWGVDYIYVRTTIERHIGGFAFEVIALEKSGRWDGVSEPGRTGTGPHANPHSIAAGPGGGEGGREEWANCGPHDVMEGREEACGIGVGKKRGEGGRRGGWGGR